MAPQSYSPRLWNVYRRHFYWGGIILSKSDETCRIMGFVRGSLWQGQDYKCLYFPVVPPPSFSPCYSVSLLIPLSPPLPPQLLFMLFGLSTYLPAPPPPQLLSLLFGFSAYSPVTTPPPASLPAIWSLCLFPYRFSPPPPKLLSLQFGLSAYFPVIRPPLPLQLLSMLFGLSAYFPVARPSHLPPP